MQDSYELQLTIVDVCTIAELSWVGLPSGESIISPTYYGDSQIVNTNLAFSLSVSDCKITYQLDQWTPAELSPVGDYFTLDNLTGQAIF